MKAIQFDGVTHQFPDDFTDADISTALSTAPAPAPQGFTANALDFVKSIPRGIVSGLTSAPNPSMVPTQDEDLAMADTRAAAKKTLIGSTHAPEGPAGKFGMAMGEGLGSPVSYIGPGGVALKVGGALLSSAASEGAGQATEGTPYEKTARVAAALAGGVAAGKVLGPGAPKAAVPTSQELLDTARQGYGTARQSGLELSPQPVASWAAGVEQKLMGPDHGFTGGTHGTAPKTFDVIAAVQNAPAGAVVTASNIDTFRKNLQRIASETQPANGGVVKPTADAAAASIALRELGDFTDNLGGLPQGSVLAGNAADYVRPTKEANGNWAAGERTRDFDARLTKAENATDRQVAGSLDSQIKTKAGQLLDNPQKTKGLSPEELAQLQLINSGGPVSNTLRQLGRGGAGVVPMATHATAAVPLAMATGGKSLVVQALLASGLYAARKGSEAITKSRAEELAEMLAKRSPEYERRVSALPPPDMSPQRAAIVRALLASQ